MAETSLRTSYVEWGKLWQGMKKHSRLYKIVLPIVFFILCIYFSGVSDYYVCTVKMSPESYKHAKGVPYSVTAARYGIRFGNNKQNEGIWPTIYPEIIETPDFRARIMNIKVHKKNESVPYTYYDYLLNHQETPWWLSIWSGNGTPSVKPDSIDVFRLTQDQDKALKSLKNTIICTCDKGSYLITLHVIDQNPYIAALMADSVSNLLQNYIIDYHVKKAQVDYEHQKKVTLDAKKQYEMVSKAYGDYSDKHRDANLKRVTSKQLELEEEMEFRYYVYSKMAEALRESEKILQDTRPAFFYVQKPSVPAQSAGPFRIYSIVMIMLWLFFIITLYVFFKEGCWKRLFGIYTETSL